MYAKVLFIYVCDHNRISLKYLLWKKQNHYVKDELDLLKLDSKQV